MTSSLFVVSDTPAPLAGMRFPTPDTDWPALHRRGFAAVIRLHPADYDPAPLVAHDLVLEDLYGGATPTDPAGEKRRVWEAARLAAGRVRRGDGVVVHCFGGKGRTGTVLVCALRELGRSAGDAIDAVRAQRPEWPDAPWQEEVARSEPHAPGP